MTDEQFAKAKELFELANEKGYHIRDLNSIEQFPYSNIEYISNSYKQTIFREMSELQRWLRNTFNIDIDILSPNNSFNLISKFYWCNIKKRNNFSVTTNITYPTYEGALFNSLFLILNSKQLW